MKSNSTSQSSDLDTVFLSYDSIKSNNIVHHNYSHIFCNYFTYFFSCNTKLTKNNLDSYNNNNNNLFNKNYEVVSSPKSNTDNSIIHRSNTIDEFNHDISNNPIYYDYNYN